MFGITVQLVSLNGLFHQTMKAYKTMKHTSLKEAKKILYKNWKFRIWHILLEPQHRLTRLKIKLRLWIKKKL